MLYSPQPFLGRIVRIDPKSGAIAVVTGAVAVRSHTSVELDSRGRLFASLGDGAVVRVNRVRGGVRTLSPGGLIPRGALALMGDDSGRDLLFVADVWSLAQFDENSRTLVDVDRRSRAGGGIVQSWTVAPDGGNVIITSRMSNAVHLGRGVRAWSSPW